MRAIWIGLAALSPLQSIAAISAGFDGATYAITSDAADDIVVGCAFFDGIGLSVTVNGAIPPDAGVVDCAQAQRFEITGGPGANRIDLGGVLPGQFSELTGTQIVGGPGNDEVIGSFADDTFVWNNGDGTDTVNLGAQGQAGDRLIVNGAPASGDAFIVLAGSGGRGLFQRVNLAPFDIDFAGVERMEVNGLGGDDSIGVGDLTGIADLIGLRIDGGDGDDVLDASALPAGVLPDPTLAVNRDFTLFRGVLLFGGDNDDTLLGSRGEDIIFGGDGNDTLIGGPGDDSLDGGAGDDTSIWNNGDGTDNFGGGDGDDRQIVNGAPGGNSFRIENDAGSVILLRLNLIPFSVSLDTTEVLEVNGGDGDDTISAESLPAGLIALELFGGAGDDHIHGSAGNDLIDGGPGNDVLIGFRGADTVLGGDGDDTLIWNPGDGTDTNDGGAGNDRVIVNGGGNADPFFIGPNQPGGTFFGDLAVPGFQVLFVRDPGFSVAIREAEILEVNGNGGDDVIDASALPSGLIDLILSGGDGNDTLIGSRGADILDGGNGDDTLIGGPGNDFILGGPGDDVSIWNNGDGSDEFEGEDGDDRQIVNGAAAGDAFEIAAGPSSGSALFRRTNLGPFAIAMSAVEALEVNGLDGADQVTTEGLPGIAQFLDGGDPAVFPGDSLTVLGFAGNLATTPVVDLPGAGSISHVNFEFQGGEPPPPAAPPQPVPAMSILTTLLLTGLCLLFAGARLSRKSSIGRS